jgi:hypothetical protein
MKHVQLDFLARLVFLAALIYSGISISLMHGSKLESTNKKVIDLMVPASGPLASSLARSSCIYAAAEVSLSSKIKKTGPSFKRSDTKSHSSWNITGLS